MYNFREQAKDSKSQAVRMANFKVKEKTHFLCTNFSENINLEDPSFQA